MRRFLRALCFTGGCAVLWALPSLCSASWLQTARLTDAAGGAGELLGGSVAIDGDVAVVAAEITVPPSVRHPGVVIVYVRTAGVWNQAAYLIASDGVAGEDAFGLSVAIHGDTIAVGAPTYGSDTGTFLKQGTVYVYVRPAGGWSGTLTENAQLQAPSVSGIPVFLGGHVSFAGDNVAVLEAFVPIALNTLTTPKQVYMFNKPASCWSGTLGPSATLTAATPLDSILNSLGASGNVVMASAADQTVGSTNSEGKALIWVQPSAGWGGTLSNVAELLASDGAALGFFGWAAAIDGNTAIVTSEPRNGSTAKAYVFERPVAGWSGTVTESAQLIGSDQINTDIFFPAISGNNVVVVTADQNVTDHFTQNLAAYVFTRPASGWSGTLSESQKLEDPQFPASSFGFFPPAISGNTIVVGAPSDTDGSNALQGAAYVFDFVRPFNTRIRFLIEGPIRVAPGVPVEFRVQVLAGARAPSEPTGEVLITDFFGQQCRARLSDTGEGSCSLTLPRAGLYLVFARYEGNSEFAPSISPPVLVVVSRNGNSR
jgi:hypothetical protein